MWPLLGSGPPPILVCMWEATSVGERPEWQGRPCGLCSRPVQMEMGEPYSRAVLSWWTIKEKFPPTGAGQPPLGLTLVLNLNT